MKDRMGCLGLLWGVLFGSLIWVIIVWVTFYR